MSDTVDLTANEETPPDGYRDIHDRCPFITLGILAKIAASGEGSFAVTLSVNGAWVSGTLIGPREFLTAQCDQMLDGVAPTDDTTRDFITALREQLITSIDGLGRAPRVGDTLYLRDARTLEGEMGLVEVRWLSVDAFSMGLLNV